MIKSLLLPFSCFLVLLSACSSPSSNTDQAHDSTALERTMPESSQFSLATYFSVRSFPIQIDTVIFEESKKLDDTFLDHLMQQIDENQGYELMIPAYKKLKSMSAEQIEKLEGFDIGEPVSLAYYNAGYYSLEHQQIDVALLGLEYETYPADPWGSGKYIFLCSFDKKGNLLGLEKIAENSAGGDPPVWGRTTTTSTSDKGLIYTLHTLNVNGEEYENGKVQEESHTTSAIITIQKDGKLLKQETQGTNKKNG